MMRILETQPGGGLGCVLQFGAGMRFYRTMLCTRFDCDSVIEQVVAETARLKQGAATSDDIDVGAMTNERQLRIVEEHIKDAVERGAQIRIGGKRLNSDAGWFPNRLS